MEIILYRNKHVAGDFEEALRFAFPRIMAFTTIAPFCTRLRPTPTQGAVIVLAAADERELTTFMSIRHLIEDAPIILILPIKDVALLAKAHKLHPRFIGDMESGAREVIAVIHKMLTRKQQILGNSTAGFH